MNQERMVHLKDGTECMIRQLGQQDLSQLTEIIRSVSEERIYILTEIEHIEQRRTGLSEQLRLGIELFIGAEVNGRVVGFCGIRWKTNPKNKHTASLFPSVLKEYRSRGIGEYLMAAVEDETRKRGVKKLFFSVFSSNEAALRFYERCGYKREGVLKEQYRLEDGYVDEIFMAKWL